MIGVLYQSDQRIVDIYKDKKTLAESSESKMSPDEVLNYIEIISANNKSMLNFNFRKLRPAT